jgi:H+/Cl- antiporter ClcA
MKKQRYQKIALFYAKFLGLCLIAGLGSGCFSVITDKAYFLFKDFYQQHHYWVLLYIPIAFGLIIFLFKNYFPYAGGSGLPQGYALDVYEKPELAKTYSLWTMFGKIILTIMSIGSGAALGREGPTIQICASIFGSMNGLSENHKKLLIRIGSGVGVATAFNAPLGGVVFAFEEYIKTSAVKINALLLLGVGIAGYMGTLVYGDYSYMGSVPMSLLSYQWKTIGLAVFSGVLCGLTGALFTWLMIYVSVNKGQFLHRIRQKHYIVFSMFFGLCVAVVGILSQGYSFGNGAFETKDVLTEGLSLPWYYGLTKSLGAIFSVAAGAPGGYFSTALSIGAGVMDTVYRIWPFVPVEQFYLLGMTGFLAAITGAPITAVAMMLSIVIDSQHFILPIMITSLLSSYIANRFGDSVYHQQVLIYVDKEKYAKTR